MSALTVPLDTIIEVLPVGVALVDPQRRIMLMNQAFRDSLDLPPDAFPPGISVEDAVRSTAYRGVYGPGDPEEQVTAVLAADRSRPGRLRRRVFQGRSFDCGSKVGFLTANVAYALAREDIAPAFRAELKGLLGS